MYILTHITCNATRFCGDARVCLKPRRSLLPQCACAFLKYSHTAVFKNEMKHKVTNFGVTSQIGDLVPIVGIKDEKQDPLLIIKFKSKQTT